MDGRSLLEGPGGCNNSMIGEEALGKKGNFGLAIATSSSI
jgi:hypothetical protein